MFPFKPTTSNLALFTGGGPILRTLSHELPVADNIFYSKQVLVLEALSANIWQSE